VSDPESRSPRLLLHAVRWGLAALVAAAGVFYAVRHPELLKALARIPPGYLLLLLAAILATRLAQSLQLKTLSEVFDARVSIVESAGLVLCNAMYNYLAPGHAALLMQAFYLKRRHQLPYSHFVSLLAASNFLLLLAAPLAGLAGCAMHRILVGPVPGPVWLAFLAVLGVAAGVGVVTALFGRLSGHLPLGRVREILAHIGEGVRLLAGNRRALAVVFLWRVVQLLCSGVTYLAAGQALSLAIGPMQALSLEALGAVQVFLPITPGGLGVREGIMAGVGHLWGFPVDVVILAAVVTRAAGMLIIFSLGPVSAHVLAGEAAKSRPRS
jgi:uncharacterized membrane protein YbhN (UPF0104 family)